MRWLYFLVTTSDKYNRNGVNPMTKRHGNLTIKFILVVVFTLYLYLLMKLILFKFGPIEFDFLLDQLKHTLANPDRIGRTLSYSGNLVPFREISENIDHIVYGGSMVSFINFAGNIVAFIPLGFMLPILFRRSKFSLVKIVFISLLLSLSFETIQLVLSIGTFDVDDLILNTSGGMIGYFIFKAGVYSIKFMNIQPVWKEERLNSKLS